MKKLMTLIGLASFSLVFAHQPAVADDLDERLTSSKNVFQELLTANDRGVPETLLKGANCIAIFPNVIKGAVGYGARFGRGVMTCRHNGQWGPPTFVTLTGGSVGFQIGAESTDLVLFFMSEQGARSLVTSSKLTLGGKVSVAAGPIGRSGEAATDLKLNAEIYSYAKSKGLFAGVSLEGARLSPDNKSNRQFYGRSITAKQLLFEHKAVKVPSAAETFLSSLP